MKSVLVIAAKDLKSYFISVRGIVILSVFLLLTGAFFSSFVHSYMEMQSRASAMGGQAPTVDQLLKALFYNMHFLIILFIPAVTMSSFAEERRAHTMRILQTAPVKALEIVLGKFFAASGLMAMVLLAAAVYPAFIIGYGSPDVGPIVTSFVGLILLSASHVAFGIWISSMTKNQLMAFVFTLLGLFVLLILSWIAPSISGGGALESTFKYLASTTHLDAFFKGVLSVADVTYFVCFTAMFVFFTNVVVDSLRWR
jgi:ABC-2 type transport system permease protein